MRSLSRVLMGLSLMVLAIAWSCNESEPSDSTFLVPPKILKNLVDFPEFNKLELQQYRLSQEEYQTRSKCKKKVDFILEYRWLSIFQDRLVRPQGESNIIMGLKCIELYGTQIPGASMELINQEKLAIKAGNLRFAPRTWAVLRKVLDTRIEYLQKKLRIP